MAEIYGGSFMSGGGRIHAIVRKDTFKTITSQSYKAVLQAGRRTKSGLSQN